MVRIQLHLTEQQARRLKALARRQGRTRAELIRQGIERVLAEPDPTGDPLLELVAAAGPAGRSDLSEAHDDVLYGRELAKPLPRVAEDTEE
jgi:hypothetical protein